jgi:dTDP-4-amino-4,6-dideoxygalactose transaminase
MHWGGNPCDVERLNSYGVSVVEDACQALGSTGIMKSRATAFSFQAIKTLTCGDGGAVVFQNKEDLERARLLKWFGLNRSFSASMRCEQDPPEAGYKMQMNDIAAAIGLENLKYLRENLDKAASNAAFIQNVIDFSDNNIIFVGDPSQSSNWLCTLLVDDSADFIAYMKNLSITCSKVHDRNDTKTIFASIKTDLPGVESFSRRHVCIPCGWWLGESDLNRIGSALRNYKDGRHSCKSNERRESLEQDIQKARVEC